MDNYIKDSEVDVPCLPPFPVELTNGAKEMAVKENTKFRNIFTFVNKLFEDPNCRKVIFKGIGEATGKCVSCVEVYKRNYKDGILYQWNKIVFTRRTDFWTPTIEGLSKILVHVDVPTIYILISRDPFPVDCIDGSCQISSVETAGFTLHNGSILKKSESFQEKPKLQRTMEPNKWNRLPKKNYKTRKQQSLSFKDKS
uniref:DNA/RNA-binding protein Alba-like domain-containing protein n=1 Tax=Setaria digitata TaxID=48799 RepID=A0A915PTM9_9BILA